MNKTATIDLTHAARADVTAAARTAVDGAPLLRRDRVFLGKGIPEPIAGRSVHDPAVIALRETLAPLAAIRALYGPELRRINKGN